MYFQYGAHRHPNDEVNLTALEVTTIYSPRGRRMLSRYTLHLTGELIYTGQAALAPKIAQLIDAYAIEDQTGALYHDDGTVTRHRIESSTVNANNITGVRVAQRSWPKGDPEEYATARTFYIRLQCDYRDLDSELVDYNERIRIVGTGPRVVWTRFARGLARPEIVNQSGIQEIVQEGQAVGFDGYPVGFVPGPLYPTLELLDQRIVTYESPQYRGAAFTHYGASWRYIMQTNTNQGGFPVVI